MAVFLFTGCRSTDGDIKRMRHHSRSSMEAEWILNGEPIEFEGELWYPSDNVEGFMDSEMYWAGEYRDVPFFVDKTDVRPYGRLYTKFGKNKFRFFEKKTSQ